MNTRMLRRARALWASGDRRTDRHNARQWIRVGPLKVFYWLRDVEAFEMEKTRRGDK